MVARRDPVPVFILLGSAQRLDQSVNPLTGHTRRYEIAMGFVVWGSFAAIAIGLLYLAVLHPIRRRSAFPTSEKARTINRSNRSTCCRPAVGWGWLQCGLGRLVSCRMHRH